MSFLRVDVTLAKRETKKDCKYRLTRFGYRAKYSMTKVGRAKERQTRALRLIMYTRLKGRLACFRIHKGTGRMREGREAGIGRCCVYASHICGCTNYLENHCVTTCALNISGIKEAEDRANVSRKRH